MKALLKKYPFLFISIGFILINLIQALYTPVIGDEAYYAAYSQNLDWGYFDHPSMVAIFIKLSSFFFSKALGIRFFTIILSGVLPWLIWKLIPEEYKVQPNAKLILFGLLFSIPVFHIYGFITTPDVPLIFFSVLFLLAIKKLEEKETLLHALFLAIAAAALIYSKYHGGVLILITAILKWKLFKKKLTWLAVIIALLLLIPHIYWQYDNHFVTFDYHLNQRTDGSFNINNVLQYLGNTLAILNPGLFILLLFSLFKTTKAQKSPVRFYIQLFWGLLIFFFLYSFRGRIEAHWIAVAMIPMLVILSQLTNSFKNSLKYYTSTIIISSTLLLSVRILVPFIDFNEGKNDDYFHKIAETAHSTPVVFINSYQNAALYNYHTGKKSTTVTYIPYRKNQFTLWNLDQPFHNQKVMLVGNWNSGWLDRLSLKSGDTLLYKFIDHFPLVESLKVNSDQIPPAFHFGKASHLSLSISNPYPYDVDLDRKEFPYRLSFMLKNDKKKYFIPLISEEKPLLKAEETTILPIDFEMKNIPKGAYTLSVVIQSGYLYPQKISNTKKVMIL